MSSCHSFYWFNCGDLLVDLFDNKGSTFLYEMSTFLLTPMTNISVYFLKGSKCKTLFVPCFVSHIIRYYKFYRPLIQ